MDILTKLLQHLDWFLDHAVWGDDTPAAGLWWSMLDLDTGRPTAAPRPAGVAKRCYRHIESPGGSNLYWDGPLVVASLAVSTRAGEPRYAEAAERYVRAYLQAAASPGGLLWWGNHYYVRADGRAVTFGSDVVAVDEAHRTAPLHETRPLPVPWPLLHRLDPSRTEAALAAHRQHLCPGAEAGCFNRHADGERDFAFLSSGGMLALALAYEAALAGEPADAASQAEQVLGFSWGSRNQQTGLLPANATHPRWDYHHATSETGLWAGAAFAAAGVLDRRDWAVMAAEAVGNWTERAWDARQGRFAGRLAVADGAHDRRPKPTSYCPGTWCDPWQPLFPAHDYPLQAAEASLTAYLHDRDRRHVSAVARWVQQVAGDGPVRNGWGTYAEQYGRAIHFLWRAGRTMSRPQWAAQGRELAAEAMQLLDGGRALCSHPWERRHDAVDGMGWLILALLALEADQEPELHGLYW